ncbi:MAG: gamma-butyrobetaine hydroxylase-like domain-containing protein [Porticoccaceae bacterium]
MKISAGSFSDMSLQPKKITLNSKRDQLLLCYKETDGEREFALPAEYLRVNSPSAEVRGHGRGQAVLQYGKRLVTVEKIEMAGNYALQIHFSDGHNSGIYTWEYLQQLGSEQPQRWAAYLEQLHNRGISRDADVAVVKFIE